MWHENLHETGYIHVTRGNASCNAISLFPSWQVAIGKEVYKVQFLYRLSEQQTFPLVVWTNCREMVLKFSLKYSELKENLRKTNAVG